MSPQFTVFLCFSVDRNANEFGSGVRTRSDKIQVQLDATSILVFLTPVWIHDHLNTVSGVLIKSQNFNG